MPKLRRYGREDGHAGVVWQHWCPACKCEHAFAVEKPFYNGARWTFDGNMDAPTFSPSMNIRTGPYPYAVGETPRIDVCHYFLKGGVIEYLADCTHAMRGQRVALPELPPRRG